MKKEEYDASFKDDSKSANRRILMASCHPSSPRFCVRAGGDLEAEI